MEKQIDQQIKTIDKQNEITQNKILKRQNKLLKQDIKQLKNIAQQVKKQLQAYRKIVLEDKDYSQVLQLQHTRIFQLQTKLQIVQNNYTKSLKSSSSKSQTELSVRCRELENRIQQNEVSHQKQISDLRAKVMKMNASQIINRKDIYQSPSTNIKCLPIEHKKIYRN